MFRFARYFFAVFLITTVIPLVLMLLWNHHQMERMRQERKQHFLDIGVKQLERTTKQYLIIKKSFILEKIQNLASEKISLKQLQDTFKADKIEFIYSHNIDKVTSYYELIKSRNSNKPVLYVVSIVPCRVSEIKGIKILEKVDFNQLRPPGPFDVEIYSGSEIGKTSFLGLAHDPFGPPEMNAHDIFHKRHLDTRFLDISKNEHVHFEKVKITDNDGKTVATLLIKPGMPPDHLGPRNPIENEFGLIVLLAGSLSSLLIGFYINKNFIKPLLALSNASKQVQDGDLSFELATDIRQEQILNTFNNFNQMIKGLKEKDELRKSFITSLTHDLRTPLIAQERSLEFISKKFEILGLKDDFELAKSLEKNNKHLLRMVNLILESYRFDSKNMNLLISNINIYELIDSCYEKLKPLASEKNIQFLNNIPEDFSLVNGDITSFKRIFLNLISNAIECISENRKIQVNGEISENFIKIFVEDDGPGIAQEDLPYIFDRYFTGKSFERKIGAGLGLDVCKKLVEMHNGEITVESQISSYTRFIVKLPFNIQENKD